MVSLLENIINLKSPQVFLYNIHNNILNDLKNDFNSLGKAGLIESDGEGYSPVGRDSR
jgi:hypothetical protein